MAGQKLYFAVRPRLSTRLRPKALPRLGLPINFSRRPEKSDSAFVLSPKVTRPSVQVSDTTTSKACQRAIGTLNFHHLTIIRRPHFVQARNFDPICPLMSRKSTVVHPNQGFFSQHRIYVYRKLHLAGCENGSEHDSGGMPPSRWASFSKFNAWVTFFGGPTAGAF